MRLMLNRAARYCTRVAFALGGAFMGGAAASAPGMDSTTALTVTLPAMCIGAFLACAFTFDL